MKYALTGLVLIVILATGIFIFGRKSSNNYPTQTTQTQVQVADNTVIIKDFAFSPGNLTVKKGTMVTWINQDSTAHSIKSDTFNSTDLVPGDKFQFTFNSTGTFNYSCKIHPSMTGTITVE